MALITDNGRIPLRGSNVQLNFSNKKSANYTVIEMATDNGKISVIEA